MIIDAILFFSIFSLFILIVYYIFFFFRLSLFKDDERNDFDKCVSIVICAKNESSNLKKFLPIVLSQDYSCFEVIVVNDQSEDETELVLKEFEENYNNLFVVTIDKHINHRPGKKFALTLGIKSAKYDYLLLTDADCKPHSNKWIEQMTSQFNKSDIILGYGSYNKKSSLLNKIIRYDTFNVAQQYLSYSLLGLTYMGVGRNIAYKKSLFFKNKGFANHIHIPSGDDDLFIQEVATNNNVSIKITHDSHTDSKVINIWKDWFYQKRRHITTSALYKIKFKILLSLYPIMQVLFWISIIVLFCFNSFVFYAYILLLIKLLVSYIANYKSMKKLNVFDLYWIHPLYEFIYLIIQVNFVLLNIIKKPNKWRR